MEKHFNPQAFKLASVDNIDVLSQYAKAYARKTSNIWYGTSIHCVEPKPNGLISTDKDCDNTSLASQVDPTSLAQQHQKLADLAHQMDTASLPVTHQGDLTALIHQGFILTRQVYPAQLAHQDLTALAHQMDTASLPVTYQVESVSCSPKGPTSFTQQMDPTCTSRSPCERCLSRSSIGPCLLLTKWTLPLTV